MKIHFCVALTVLASAPICAETMKWGVNAAVGNATVLYETQENYKVLVDKIASDTKIQLETLPLYSSLVKTALEKSNYPFYLVHTSEAAAFVKEKKFTLVALSNDLDSNRIAVLAKKDSTAKSLSDLAGKC